MSYVVYCEHCDNILEHTMKKLNNGDIGLIVAKCEECAAYIERFGEC